ncbi:hypothetical protein [Brevibacillus formosus]|uniref:hypothetical protein n=1 Tax=Brevibacillus formosus TaxID=54913 RepID=UPI003F1C9518
MFKKKEKQIVNQYAEEEYRNLLHHVQVKFPDEPLEQVEYVRQNNDSRYYVMMLVEIAQRELAKRPTLSEEMNISPMLLEYMLRGFMDAVAHMQDELPEGVYDYIKNKSDTFLLKCIEHAITK